MAPPEMPEVSEPKSAAISAKQDEAANKVTKSTFKEEKMGFTKTPVSKLPDFESNIVIFVLNLQKTGIIVPISLQSQPLKFPINTS